MMCSKELLLIACLGLLGGLRLTSTTTTTTFVAAMSIANQDLERYFRAANSTQALASEDRIAMDTYTYAFLNYSYMVGKELVIVAPKDETARYGEGRILTVTGTLVHVKRADDSNDDFACTPNISGTKIPGYGQHWIALVRRGRCTFEEKVKNVHGKGAAGVIVFNDKPVMNLEKMQIKGKTRNITAVITYQDTGLEMARLADDGHEITISIIEGKSGTRPINNLNRTSVLFVSISFIVLMVISLVWLIFYYIQRFRYLHNKDQQSRHLCSVTKKAIMKIPTKTGKSSDEKDADSDCCAICIEAYKPSDCIRVLPCKHEFHKNCIDPWLIEHRTCPMCKLDVLKFYGFVFLGSEESILEYEPEVRAAIGANGATTIAGSSTTQHLQLPPTRAGALADLIRSRDFVVDFPRVFILEGGSTTGTHESLFPGRLPERSQSSLSLAQAKDWMSSMSNKLEEQNGLKRLRRQRPRNEMEEHLLDVRSESLKKRRSRSADARYSSGFFERRELSRLQQLQHSPPKGAAESRQDSAAFRIPTESSCAQSTRQVELEMGPFSSIRRASNISLPSSNTPPHSVLDMHVQPEAGVIIQINGEGVELE